MLKLATAAERTNIIVLVYSVSASFAILKLSGEVVRKVLNLRISYLSVNSDAAVFVLIVDSNKRYKII